MTTGELVRGPLKGHSDDIQSVAVGKLNGRTVAVVGSGDLRVWDLVTGKQVGRPFTGPDNSFASVALGTLNGRPIAVSAGRDKTVRVWDLGPPYPAPLS
ncbi:MAG: WD40 repeat domain-containing protein [Spirillospora sp.]